MLGPPSPPQDGKEEYVGVREGEGRRSGQSWRGREERKGRA